VGAVDDAAQRPGAALPPAGVICMQPWGSPLRAQACGTACEAAGCSDRLGLQNTETLVAARPWGHRAQEQTHAHKPAVGTLFCAGEPSPQQYPALDPLTIHRGTQRSGDTSSGGIGCLVLVVNPGRGQAPPDTCVWAVAGHCHAGAWAMAARIVCSGAAPAELRTHAAVAEATVIPLRGLREEARWSECVIRIDPAEATWPLGLA